LNSSVNTLRRHRRARPRGRVANAQSQTEVRALLGDSPRRRDLLIEFLHRIQDRFGHLSTAHITALAQELGLAPVEVYEVASFYHHFDVIREGETPPPALTVRVCDSITCALFGADALARQLEQTLGEGIRIQRVPCVGRCETAPIAVVGTRPIGSASAQRVKAAVEHDETTAPAGQPVDYESYREDGGYRTLGRCVGGGLERERILSALEDSGLRGLGGAGFPVGRKWHIVAEQPAPRLMAVNIDEGEPGTFKDRYYLERDPHRFLEGMLMAARVVGIQEIYIYLRDEYAGCREILSRELASLRGHLPYPIPPIQLRRGAGAYICGEESAMIESIEGKRGMPRLRPPYVAQVGLFARPTLVHNLETLYWVRDILEKGPNWFTAQGRRGRKGLRSFSVSGRVRKPGVHLAPAGICVRELIDEYCDGMLPGHRFYAYFPGGASGGLLPAELGALPLDFGTLEGHSCFIGSAAVIVLSDRDSARTAALNAMRFFAHESCGKCTPCRAGTAKAVALMEHTRWDPDTLRDLARVMREASICGLGQAAPNPLECVMRYFPQELNDGRQP
jgi:NADH:ubiquinone oxidoreductase subunit F (NADH-binding)/NADH:ubiquinone oxidoreductase subunit E